MSQTELIEDEKKGGPYSEKERKIRREKVAELFFEKGYSVVMISRMLNVNRNTITNDLKCCFSELKKEFSNFDLKTIYMTQFHRMEIQRRRLVDLLYKNIEFNERLPLERLISDIENKIMQSALKIDLTIENIEKFAIALFNSWAKEQQPSFRGFSKNILEQVSPKAYEKIDKIIKDDQKNTHGYAFVEKYDED